MIPCLLEKPLNVEAAQTVPITDSGGQDENSQAIELNQAKKLGKLPPYVRNKVGQQRVRTCF